MFIKPNFEGSAALVKLIEEKLDLKRELLDTARGSFQGSIVEGLIAGSHPKSLAKKGVYATERAYSEDSVVSRVNDVLKEHNLIVRKYKCRGKTKGVFYGVDFIDAPKMAPTKEQYIAAIKRGYFELRDFTMPGADLEGADLSNCNLHNAGLAEAILRDVDFSNANLSGACIGRADLRGARFDGADMFETRFDDADLRGAKFNKARIDAACFDDADLRDADFRGVLHNAEVEFVRVDLRGAMFDPDTLRNAKFEEITVDVDLAAHLAVFRETPPKDLRIDKTYKRGCYGR